MSSALKRFCLSNFNKCITVNSSKCNGIKLARCFSSALKSASNASIASELSKTLRNELESHKEQIKELPEDFDIKTVLENHSDFLKEHGWTIEHPEGSTLVTLMRRDANLKADIVLKYDLMEVFSELYQQQEEEEAMDYEEAEETSREIESKNEEFSEEIDENEQFLSFPFTLEVKRDAITDKFLKFDCFLNGSESENQIVIEDAQVIPRDTDTSPETAYLSPNYSDLDEKLQENFEEFVNELVHSEPLMDFMASYSFASEAKMYKKWLIDVADLVKN